MKSSPASPRNLLLPYQRRWADDASRWKFGLMARQTGKDFCAAEEGVRDCFLHERNGGKTTWLIVAPSERQSSESLAKWKEWTEAYNLAIADIRTERNGGDETLLKSVTVMFPRGSRIIAVPGRPDTVRGYSANVLLTEFAFFEDPDATWRAIIPAATNPLRGGPKKVRLITTPNGIGNRAYDLWTKNYRGAPVSETRRSTSNDPTAIGSAAAGPADTSALQQINTDEHRPICENLSQSVANNLWSCHFVDIYRAVQEGLPVNIDELRAAVDDPEGWAREFECQFLDTQSVLLPYDLIASCESAEAATVLPADYWEASLRFPIDLGIDFGRKRDLTVCWANAQLGDVAQTIEVLELAGTDTPRQMELLRPRLKRARRVCLDYTGPGVGLGDFLVREFGEWAPERHRNGKIELVTFTNAIKVELFSKLRMAFEKRAVRIPVSRLVREDLHSMNRVTTATGGVTYRAPHSADGHADRCTALALALRAGESQRPSFFLWDFGNSKINRVMEERRRRTLQ